MNASTLSIAFTALVLQSPQISAPTVPAAGGGSIPLAIGVVQLQPTTPGTAQNGHSNISGTSIAGAFKGDGSLLTNLNADKISTGTLNDARLSGNVAQLAGAQTFAGAKSFSAAPTFNASGAPFAVGSTTKVANLNGDLLDGFDSSAFLQAVPSPLILNSATSTTIQSNTSADNNYGIVGSSTAPTIGWGIVGWSSIGGGVYGTSYDGTGVTGYSAVNGDGVYGIGVAGHGVKGISLSNDSAVYGSAGGSGAGVEGVGGTLNGVEGRASYPYTACAGVYGEHSGGQYGVAGRSTTGSVFGSDVGVWGETLGPSGWAVYSNGRMYVNGNFYASGSKVGCVTDIVKNGDREPLEAGDLEEIMGADEPVLGTLPVIVVRKASSANATGVLGPIASAIQVLPNQMKSPPASDPKFDGLGPALPRFQLIDVEGAIAPGGYGHVVTLGSFRTIKVDASYGPITPGTLLVASPHQGYAAAANHPEVGTVIGKALGTLISGTGEIGLIVHQQ